VDHCAPWAAAFEHSGPRNSRKTVAGFRVSGGSDGQEAQGWQALSDRSPEAASGLQGLTVLSETAARVTAELSRLKAAGRIASFTLAQHDGLAGVTVQMPDGSAGGVAWHSANPAIKPAAVMSDLRRKLGIA